MGILLADLNNTLIMLNLMKMILKILFMSGFWFGIIYLNNAKNLKKKEAKTKCLQQAIRQYGGIGAYQKLKRKKQNQFSSMRSNTRFQLK